MAAAGTGLPTQRGPVASTITDTAGYGAGEMAAADGFARAAQGLGRLQEAIEPAARQAAKAIAEQDVLAGNFRERVAITAADADYNGALRQGTLARLSTAADRDLDALRTKHVLDPEGFEKAVRDMRTSSLEAAVPGSLAMDWSADFDRRANAHLGVIRNARAEADLREARGAIETRIANLTDETVNLRAGATLADVMADDQVGANLLQIRRGFDALAENPAFGMSQDEADAKYRETADRIAAGAVSAYAVETLRTEGADAAYAALQTILTDETIGDRQSRQLAYATAREAVQQEVSLTNQRTAQAEAERSRAQQELNRLMAEDVASVELTGEGSGLTAEQVRAAGGNDALARWYKSRADAAEFHGLVGSLPLDDPEAAAAQITTAIAARGFSALPAIGDESDLNTIASAIIQVESGGRNGLVSGDPDGAGPAGGGAYGVMQVLPDTARRIAGQLGLPFDAGRLRTDRAYNERIGRAYLTELIDRYNGDTFLAITAYHAGEGNVDGWLRSVGDPRSGGITREAWLQGVESRGNPRSAAYPRKVLAAMNAGRANATWDAYRGQQTARRTDPAGFVQRDFAVAAARQRWTQTPTSVPASEAFVQANLAAQERANVASGDRRSLPAQTLAIYAGDLTRFERAGDAAGFQGYADSIVRQFGSQGQRVLQDVHEVRGDTRYAAMVAARATAGAARGQRPTQQQVAQANTAGRANTMQRAAAGTGAPMSARSDAEILAAAGLTP